jgi:hypothetical protein
MAGCYGNRIAVLQHLPAKNQLFTDMMFFTKVMLFLKGTHD